VRPAGRTKEIAEVRDLRVKQALAPLATNPDLRNLLKKIAKAAEQTIDMISQDKLLYAGPAQASTKNNAATAKSFRDYIEQHKAEITALQILYSRPFKQRLTEPMLKDLEMKLKTEFGPHPVDTIWHAYEVSLAPIGGEGRGEGASVSSVKSVVKKNPACRFADLVSLVRFALEQQPVLAPFADSVTERFNEWLMDKAKAGVKLSGEQLAWLNLIRDHIATSLSIEPDDFDYAPFSQRGGLGKAHQLFGDTLLPLLDELNLKLVA
jgi:type I restriction enzyme R subunit